MRQYTKILIASLLLALLPALSVWATDYAVSSPAELAAIAANNDAQNGYAGDVITLTADINLSSAGLWTGIGTETKPFQGTFDGDGHLISGMTGLNGIDGCGLFGFIGPDGVVKNIGISDGTLTAINSRRYIGALAGVCAGTITNCWSMAQIMFAGNVIGGLVGTLTATGKMIDVYSVGPVFSQYSDTVGALVGFNNGGSVTRAYSTGYAKNGKGFVGKDANGSYSDCFFDRKLYFLEPGVSHAGLVPVDTTSRMFTILSGGNWTNTPNRYPQLTSFVGKDASTLSVAPLFIDSVAQPADHANDLQQSFTFDIAGGITWACRNEVDTELVRISGNKASVKRPCTDRDVLLDAKLNGYTHTFYLRPRRLEDMQVGPFSTSTVEEVCFADNLSQPAMPTITGGTEPYHYRVTLDSIDHTTLAVKKTTVLADDDDNTFSAYTDWRTLDTLPTNLPGHYVLHFYAHDEGCFPDWTEAKSTFQYIVYPEVKVGNILPNRNDTVYTPDTVTIIGTPTTGGKSQISYQWFVNDNTLTDSIGPNIIKHVLTDTGTYIFTRSSMDSLCYPNDTQDKDEGADTLLLIYPFDPGAVTIHDTLAYCDMDDAKAWIITDTLASRAVESFGYEYQWYSVVDGDTVAISGATNHSLSLANVDLQIGKTYTFLRAARNIWWRCDTTWSRHQQVVHILAPYTKGSIEAKTDTVFTPSAVSVTGTAPTGGFMPYIYQWYLNSTALSGATENNLPSQDLVDLGWYRYTRVSADSLCQPDLDSNDPDDGMASFLVIDTLDPAQITFRDTLVYCTVPEAEALTISGEQATGGVTDLGYSYQWYRTTDGSAPAAIPRATDKDLLLSGVAMETGKTYTFTRMAKNNWTRNDPRIDWKESKGAQTVHILAALVPGAIETTDLGRLCMNNGETTWNISIAELTPAAGEETLEYKWQYTLDGDTHEILTNAPALDYNLNLDYDNNANKEYVFTRFVRQGNCDWKQSDGSLRFSFGREQHHTKNITICADKLPYTLTRTTFNGTTRDTTFTADGQKWIFNDSTGCNSDTTFFVHVKPMPQVSVDTVMAVCQLANSLTLSFDVESGDADYFRIHYSDELADLVGSSDTADVITEPGTITLQNMPVLQGEKYSLTVEFSDTESGDTPDDYCYTDPQTVRFQVALGGYVYSKFDRILFVDNNAENGLLPAPKLTFKAYQWYRDGKAVEGETGQYYHENNILSGTYYVLLTDTEGNTYRSCDITMPSGYASEAPKRHIYPVPVNAGETVTVLGEDADIRLISASGEQVLRCTCTAGQASFKAPSMAGFYFVRIDYRNGRVETEKLIVK